MLFDDFHRTDNGRLKPGETVFQLYNRSARPEFARVRDLLERAVADYPESERKELIARLRSKALFQSASAEFELLLCYLLQRSGYDLMPHPELPNGRSQRPDFLVTTPDGDRFYLEAVLASEATGTQVDGPLVAPLTDKLRDASHPTFQVSATIGGYPTTQPSAKRLLREVLRWLDSLDPGDTEELPTFEWDHEDLRIRFTAAALPIERRNSGATLLPMYGGEAGWINTWSGLRDNLRFKATYYGALDLPLVVAANHMSRFFHPSEGSQALFGPLQVTVNINDPDAPGQVSHAPDGVWLSPGGPINKRLSAAWIFNHLAATEAAKASPILFLNPWANIIIPTGLLQFPHARVEDEHLAYHDGASVPSLLGCPRAGPRPNLVPAVRPRSGQTRDGRSDRTSGGL